MARPDEHISIHAVLRMDSLGSLTSELLKLLLDLVKLGVSGGAELMENTESHNVLGEVRDSHSHDEPATSVRIIEEGHDMSVCVLALAGIGAVHHEVPQNIVGSGDLLIITQVWEISI